MVDRDVLTVVFVISGAIGLVVLLSAFFELRRRLRRKITAESENQT